MRVSGAVAIRCVVLALVHFATVEHQDNQANDEGAGQFEGACAHQRDEAEHATQYRTNQANKVTDVDAFETNQVNTGVEVRQHGQQYRDTGQFAEQVRGCLLSTSIIALAVYSLFQVTLKNKWK